MDYQSVRGDAKVDKNDCTVVAIAVTTGISYSEAQALLAKAGRKRNKGVGSIVYHGVIRELGFTIKDIRKNLIAKTVRTIERELAENYGDCKVLIGVRGHVLSWNGKKIVDWSAGRMHRITSAYHIYPGQECPVGRSVSIPQQKPMIVTARPRSAIIASCSEKGIYEKHFRSVKAAYEGLGLNLRGHQKMRRWIKYNGSHEWYAWAADEYNSIKVSMRLDK